MTWHADAPTLRAYASNELDDARAFSIEAHLLACAECRAACVPLVERARVDATWVEVLDRVDQPRARVLERVMEAFGVRAHIARLVAATPSLQLSWFVAVAVALTFAVVAAHGSERGMFVYLMLAPLFPLAGIAAAYGPGIDPTYEIGLSSPMRSYRLLLIRALAVLTTSMGLVGASALALPRLDWTAAAWLLPALALSSAVLALGMFVRPVAAASWLSAVWVAVVLAAERASSGELAAFRATGQAVCAAITVAGAVWVVVRRDSFELELER